TWKRGRAGHLRQHPAEPAERPLSVRAGRLGRLRDRLHDEALPQRVRGALSRTSLLRRRVAGGRQCLTKSSARGGRRRGAASPPKPTTACTTPAAEGMVVRTNTPLAVGARADILEYELVNHPLDCPICDKGGECPLQDYTFRHGYPTSRIDAPRLHFRKPIPLSDNIALDRERCVLCYRCTRYYDEIAWQQELTVEQRGVHSYIASEFDRPLKS